MKSNIKRSTRILRKAVLPVAIATVLSGMGFTANAFQFNTDNEDIDVRFDNTIRYNAAWRLENRDPGLANNAAQDENEYLFDKGDMVANRVDLYSELDFTYQKRMGFRVTGSAWYDDAYGNKKKSNPALPGPSYPGNQYTDYVKRYYNGPSAEFTDAFVWSNFELGATKLNVKAGRHVQLWGEASFPTASSNSVANDMAPSDGQKQAVSPGATAKETSLPISQLTGTWQLANNLSVAGQYTFEWRPTRVPEGGTYFGIADGILFGPPLVQGAGNAAGGLAAAPITRINSIEGEKGDWGLAVKWRPELLGEDSSLGFYYREYDAKSPIWAAQLIVGAPLQAVNVYARNIKLWGMSYSTVFQSAAVNFEVSHRENTMLNQNPNVPSTSIPGYEGPRGDTWHAILNSTQTLNTNALWDTAALVMELTYQKLDKVTKNKNSYKSLSVTSALGGAAAAACSGDEIVKGCSTDDAWHFAAFFKPTWQQIAPSWDLSGRLIYQVGLKGNAPTTGINEGASVVVLGLEADYAQRHKFSLNYNTYWAKKKYLGSSSIAGSTKTVNGTFGNYSDRDNLAFTYDYTF